jgi:hypothetical protein
VAVIRRTAAAATRRITADMSIRRANSVPLRISRAWTSSRDGSLTAMSRFDVENHGLGGRRLHME